MKVSNKVVDFIKSLEMIYLGILFLQILFAGAIFLLIHEGALYFKISPFDQAMLLWILIFLITHASYDALRIKFLHRIKMQPSRKMMLKRYKFFLIVRIAILEIPIIAGIVLSLFYLNPWLLIGVICCSLVLIPLKPSVDMMVRDLRLRESELINLA